MLGSCSCHLRTLERKTHSGVLFLYKKKNDYITTKIRTGSQFVKWSTSGSERQISYFSNIYNLDLNLYISVLCVSVCVCACMHKHEHMHICKTKLERGLWKGQKWSDLRDGK